MKSFINNLLDHLVYKIMYADFILLKKCEKNLIFSFSEKKKKKGAHFF